MFTEQQFRRIVHTFCDQRLVNPPGSMPVQSRSNLAVEYDVTISPRSRRKPCMKVIGYGPRPHDRNVVGQIAVCTSQPASLAAITMGIEVHDLSTCMYASVCTPCAGYFNVFVGDFCEGFLHERLYTVTRPLSLPTVVPGTVVLNAESYAQSGS